MFYGNRPTGYREEDFKDFNHICPWRPFGHVTTIMLISFHFLVPESLHTKFGQNGRVVSEKGKFEFSCVNYLGPRSRNDIDLQYSHTFICPIICLHLPTFESQAAIVLKKNPLFSLFPVEKPMLLNLVLQLK